MTKPSGVFGIFEVFSHTVPGLLILLSGYLLLWPNPSLEMVKQHVELFVKLSLFLILFGTSYVIGFIFYPVGSFITRIIQKLFKTSAADRFSRNLNFNDIQDLDNPSNTNNYGRRLKTLLDNNYGSTIHIWQIYKQCESAVRAEYPQNAIQADRYHATGIMSRQMGIAILFIIMVLLANLSLGRIPFSLAYIMLIVVLLLCSSMLIYVGIHYSYWALREIFNTYYYMLIIAKQFGNKGSNT